MDKPTFERTVRRLNALPTREWEETGNEEYSASLGEFRALVTRNHHTGNYHLDIFEEEKRLEYHVEKGPPAHLTHHGISESDLGILGKLYFNVRQKLRDLNVKEAESARARFRRSL